MLKRLLLAAPLVASLLTASLFAQRNFGGGGGGGGGFGGNGGGGGFNPRPSANGLVYLNGDPYGREPDGRLYSWPRRPTDLSDRQGVPTWPIDPHYKSDLFTFARVNWYSTRYSDAWLTDYPTSDLNISFRLPELTTIRTNPNPVTVKFTDPNLSDYPFTYMVEVSTLEFQPDEIPALRKYLLNGGFLMVDDFWGEQAWDNFHKQMQRIFPDREPVDLPLDHPLFHIVFDLKEKPQVPGIEYWAKHKYATDGSDAYERPDAKGAHYWAYSDDKGRICALICQNTDLGDGWSRELSTQKLLQNIDLKNGDASSTDNERYFHEFCERLGYPMGVNIIFYAMTH